MLAVASLWQGGIYLSERENPTSFGRVSGLALSIVGVSLLIGFLTPFCGGFIFLHSALPIFLSLQRADLETSALCTIVLSVVLVLLGPGAFSLDARLFGRREIIIPALDEKSEKSYEANKNNQKKRNAGEN
jgi:uncharacterized membrane protein YphA (DoxX/SURF4 family)